jgi:DNA (cytosine-5)-methyltransferase 1
MSPRRKILVADLLCGAGGSSTGCARALAELGLEMELVCVNHWPVAIDTHARNHPQARHYCQDISTVRPHLVVPEGYLDLLMASPSCTHHSVARGGKPTSDQQRSDPWHIITWLTELQVKCLIIENVWEFVGWGPVDPLTGKTIVARKGEYFRAWIGVLRQLGYVLEWRKLNAADYGAATTRQRFFLIARKDGTAIEWPAPTHSRGGKVPGTIPWRPARDIIDWSIKGKSIFGRKKPLAMATLERLFDGALKSNWPEPFLVILRNHMNGRSLDSPLPTITAGGQHIGLAQPIILNRHSGNGGHNRASLIDGPMPTITTRGGGYLAEPVIWNGRRNNEARPVSEAPVASLDTKGGVWLAEPFILAQASGGVGRPVGEPMPTACTGGALALISPYYGSGSGETCSSVENPLPTATARARFGLAVPITHSGARHHARDVDHEPLQTLTTAKRGELALVEGVDDAPHYDILYRMLEAHELGAAMGFIGEAARYQFAGNKTQQIKQIGNAVSVDQMFALVRTLMADDSARPVPMLEAAE